MGAHFINFRVTWKWYLLAMSTWIYSAVEWTNPLRFKTRKCSRCAKLCAETVHNFTNRAGNHAREKANAPDQTGRHPLYVILGLLLAPTNWRSLRHLLWRDITSCHCRGTSACSYCDGRGVAPCSNTHVWRKLTVLIMFADKINHLSLLSTLKLSHTLDIKK